MINYEPLFANIDKIKHSKDLSNSRAKYTAELFK